MTSRHEARKRALDLLYEADIRARSLDRVLTDQRADEGLPAFAAQLVEGVRDRLAEIDAMIMSLARGWTLERMPVVDRNILRLGLYELHHTDVPHAVVIDEAVQLAKDLSTDDSGRYVNGILARAARQLEAAGAPEQP